ncbi:uncharacterized protein [Drosophila kikkawai]|uniref:Uncharacterized protein n=1 Tax=Drosophila kikkawai TaxID=30033 RepID=A0A6P4IXU5_DROKI|nr:pollen-specific leucine-rich repeat extensin-like protein 1 [Drosophila kikkawai]
MSNLQDVPLNESEGLPGEDAQMSKTNSLKRFFKLSKKPALKEYGSETSIEGDNKELGKSKTLSRIFSRRKIPNKDGPKKDEPNTDGPEQSSSMSTPNQQDKPLTTTKPGVKSSMSMYWKRLFHLHKAQNQDEGSGPEQTAVNGPEEVHELQLVPNDSEVQIQDSNEPDLEAKPKLQPEAAPKTQSEKAPKTQLEKVPKPQPETTQKQQPEKAPKPESKKLNSDEKILSALESGLVAQPKEEKPKEPAPVVANP